ncbi:hypothetical protein ACKAXX_003498 [Escherichia coli]|uniref:hypothetical protein n=1 Tax=Escherichia coli TaxID=562 RepID=UPI000B1505C9|nr:hypothetical protein [Escherichia coli]MEE1489840.1 hypothetical protein [Shigella flexneri]VTQ34339.1 Uncharacterised protein [Streptococcus pneumoniae]MCA7865911.1 hypothetical protein [Escherichia coli]MCI3432942.1 hypothetical protein [Escherichia coli]MCK2976277.1 hypothetical protein [Escherichia coli]
MNRQKPFRVSKLHVVEAYRRIKANAGVDNQMLKDFERDLKGNLYKIWNRLSSGSWMPPPVRAVQGKIIRSTLFVLNNSHFMFKN